MNPAEVVQLQLDAYNAKNVAALVALYADDAELYEHPSTLLAKGSAALRERFTARFKEPHLHAVLLHRVVAGDLVIDHERVTRDFPEGLGTLELTMLYEVKAGRIARAWTIAGARTPGAPAPGCRLEHVALWSQDIERLREFYCRHFGCTAGPRYENPAKGFSSYFLRFASGARLELMQQVGVTLREDWLASGPTHFAIALGSEAAVRALTERLRRQGVKIAGEPRRTGDGYFESVIEDPDGNPVELTV
jgi:lactoylglutathione lyase